MQGNVIIEGRNAQARQFVLENVNAFKILSHMKLSASGKVIVNIESLKTQRKETVHCEHDKKFNVLFG